MPSPVRSPFDSLVREHQAGLRAFIRSLGGEASWVDDLAQEAFLIAYRRLDDLEDEADFGKWVRGIARHLLANERRKEARRARLLPFAIADSLLDQPSTPELDSERVLSALQHCVASLPPESRDLLTRRYAGGVRASDLAKELRANASAVRQNLLRLRLTVKHCVERRLAGVSS